MTWAAIGVGVGSAVAGGVAAKQGRDAQAKAARQQLAAQNAAYGQAQIGMGPYAALGPGSQQRLGELLGLEGFRTPSDIALREHLASRPENAYGFTPGKRSAAEELLNKNWDIRNASKVESSLGLDQSPLSLSGMRKKRKKKDAKRYAAETAAAEAKYTQELAAWEAKKAELEKQRDVELQSYDPTAVLQKTPGYQYRYDLGNTAATNQLNKLGMSQSGRGLKELTNYGQNFATNEYQNEINRLTGVSNSASNAQNSLSQLLLGQGGAQAQAYGNIGDANAAYATNMNNAVQGGLSNYLSASRRQSSYAPQPSYTQLTDNPDYPTNSLDYLNNYGRTR